MDKILVIIILILFPVASSATDLIEALAYAYKNNPELLANRENLKQYAEQNSSALADFLPNIQFQRSRTRNKAESQFAPSAITSKTINNQISIQQSLFNSGSSVSNLRYTRKSFESQLQNTLYNEQQFITKAIGAYLGVMQGKEDLDTNNNNVELLKKTLRSVKEQFNQGELTNADVLAAEADLASAIAKQIEANGGYLIAKAAYKRYFLEEPENLKLPELPSELPADLDVLINQAKIYNPALLAAKAAIEANAAQIWTKAAGLGPQVTLNASGSKIKQHDNPSYDRNKQTSQKQVTLQLTVPIYQGGREYASIRQAKIAYQQSKSNSANISNQIVQDAIATWEGFTAAKEALVSQEKAVISANGALAGYREEFAVGMITLVDLLNAEQKLFNTKLNLSKAKYQKLTSAFNIYNVLGKLTGPGLALPVEYFDPEKYYRKTWVFLPHLSTK